MGHLRRFLRVTSGHPAKLTLQADDVSAAAKRRERHQEVVPAGRLVKLVF
jgi:hypothetical protein